MEVPLVSPPAWCSFLSLFYSCAIVVVAVVSWRKRMGRAKEKEEKGKVGGEDDAQNGNGEKGVNEMGQRGVLTNGEKTGGHSREYSPQRQFCGHVGVWAEAAEEERMKDRLRNGGEHPPGWLGRWLNFERMMTSLGWSGHHVWSAWHISVSLGRVV